MTTYSQIDSFLAFICIQFVMGKRTLPTAYLTPAPRHPQLCTGSPASFAASGDYALPVLDLDDLLGLGDDEIGNLWSDRYEYDVLDEIKHAFLQHFDIDPKSLPDGRVN